MSKHFICPRRDELGIPLPDDWPKRDRWDKALHGRRSCSWCGSMHPDDFMAAMRSGVELGPTDKSYKVYVDQGSVGKFYFQHLDEAGRREFVDLYNDRPRRRYGDDLLFTVTSEGRNKVAIGYPGYFYRLPFFMR